MSVVICLMCERRDGIMFSATAWNVAVLSPLLGITWLFGVLSVSRQTVVFQYIFAITNTLQVQQHSLLPTRLCIRLDSAVAEGPRDDPSHSVPPLRVTSKDFDNLAAR